MGLVLSRQKSERIFIGDDIFVTVIEIRGDKVRIAISAPQEIPVHREEVYQKLQSQGLATNDLPEVKPMKLL